MVLPAALLFLGVTLVNLLLSEGVAPFANSRSTLLVETPSDVRFVHRKARSAPLVASRHPIVYPEFDKDGGLARLFFARRFDSSRMLDVTLVEMQPSPEPETTTSNPTQLSSSGTVQSSRRSRASSSVEETEESKGGNAQRVSRAILAKAARWQGEGRGWMFLEGAEYCYDEDRASGPNDNAPVLPEFLNGQRFLQELHTFQQKAVSDLAHTPIDLAQAAGRNFDDMSFAQSVKGLHPVNRNSLLGDCSEACPACQLEHDVLRCSRCISGSPCPLRASSSAFWARSSACGSRAIRSGLDSPSPSPSYSGIMPRL